MKALPWLVLALIGSLTSLYGLSVHSTRVCLLSKPVPVLVGDNSVCGCQR